MIILSLLGIGLFIGLRLLLLCSRKDPEALRQIVVALRIDAFNQPGLAISLILAGVLQGMETPRHHCIVQRLGCG